MAQYEADRVGGAPGGGADDGETAAAPESKRATVLVVDDEQVNRVLVRRFIADRHQVLEAADGAEAVRIVRSHDVDLVLLDVMLPGESGFDVCKRLKQASTDHFLPVLLLTALAQQEDRNTGLAAGADDYLSKPVDRVELLLRIQHFLELREQRRIIAQQFATLREMDALKDDLVTLLVHDLRNPLAGVLAFLHIFEQELKTTSLGEDAALARGAAEQLKETLDDLLQVRLLEEGRLEPKRQAYPVTDVIERAAKSVAGTAAIGKIRIERKVPPELTGSFDDTLVRRAVENLLQNAIRYAPSGSVVEVAAARDDRTLVISVSDGGTGIATPARSQLFLKFGGLRMRTGGERRGFGLGLYFVRLVAEAHGGAVAVADRPGGGTIMTLRLAGA